MATDISRRKLLRALAVIPVVVVGNRAAATTNVSLRAQLKYQGTPQGDMSCANCLDFIPGRTAKDLGGCARIPGDDEISPNGYCAAWNTM